MHVVEMNTMQKSIWPLPSLTQRDSGACRSERPAVCEILSQLDMVLGPEIKSYIKSENTHKHKEYNWAF